MTEKNTENNLKVSVVDAPCGKGKTSWAIQYMNNNRDKKFIFITPFLTEIERIKESTNRNFKSPNNYGNGKLEQFNELIKRRQNVASTHALFSLIDVKTRKTLEKENYVLILDEVLDVVNQYDIKADDVKLLLEKNVIYIDNERYICWRDDTYSDGKFTELKLLAQNKSLIYIENRVILWTFPIEVFKAFKEVNILTYMFDAQIQKYYYDYHNINYTKYGVYKINKIYKLKEYDIQDEIDYIGEYGQLINVFQGKINNIGSHKGALSATWYKNANRKTLAKIKDNLYNYFQHKIKAKSNTIIWTCYKKYKNIINGKGYTKYTLIDKCGEPLLDENGKTIQRECFLPCNIRATNDYLDKYNLAYCCNLHINPVLLQFFNLKNIDVNQDMYALSELLQWIFRSRIRNGQKINIFIPSKRMRSLLINWINCESLTSETCKNNAQSDIVEIKKSA